MDEQAMRVYLTKYSEGASAAVFAAHVLRNYSIKQRAALGASIIEQAYTLLRSNMPSDDAEMKG